MISPSESTEMIQSLTFEKVSPVAVNVRVAAPDGSREAVNLLCISTEISVKDFGLA